MDIIEHAILNILEEHKGSENRIKRPALRQEITRRARTPVSDRVMRNALENLRRSHPKGAMICSDTEQGGGYFQARDLAELEIFLNADEARIVHLAQRIRAQRRRAGLAESGQLRLL